MFDRVPSFRTLTALTAVSALLAGCSSATTGKDASSSREVGGAQSAGVTPMAGPLQVPAAPAPPAGAFAVTALRPEAPPEEGAFEAS